MSIFTLYCSFSRATLLEEIRTRWLSAQSYCSYGNRPNRHEWCALNCSVHIKQLKKGKHALSSVVSSQIAVVDITHFSPEGFSINCIIKWYFIKNYIHLLYEVVEIAQWLRGWMQRKEEKETWDKDLWFCLQALCPVVQRKIREWRQWLKRNSN